MSTSTIYHGALKTQSPVTVTVKTGRTKSKYSKPNAPKPDFVTLTIAGQDYYYPTENEACAEFFADKVGQTFALVAEGRAETATLTAVGAPASQLQQPPPRPALASPAAPGGYSPNQPPPSPTAPPATASRDALSNVRHFVARNRVLAIVALQAAESVKHEFEVAFGRELPDFTYTAIFSSMLYGAAQNGHTAANQGLPLDLKFTPKKHPLAEGPGAQ